ncbi:PAS domain-containing protein [Parvibaculum sp.]|uniref:PAS domain-containing protein n=1 Tax=Parvibaculum sp. TaxID=2024848 RepID=UPI0032111551
MERGSSSTGRHDDGLQYPSAPDHPGVAALAGYWLTKRGQRPMPDRSDIVPGEIVKLLPNLIICDVLGDGEDFRTRIFGTALVLIVGEERTGKCLSEFGTHASVPTRPEVVQFRWLDVTRRAYRLREPVFINSTMSSSDRPYLSLHAVAMPLTAGGSEIAQMIGGMFVTDRR